jgi:hypothetical protein
MFTYKISIDTDLTFNDIIFIILFKFSLQLLNFNV